MRATISIFLLALFCCCSWSSAKLFDDELRELTEFLRLQMRCGYSDRGVPILAPAQAAYREINTKTDNFGCQGNFTDLLVEGLDSFDFARLEWNNILHTIKFDINFAKLDVTSANYKLDLLGRLFGADLSLWGDGEFALKLTNFRGVGSFVIRPNSLTSGVHIKSWKVDWSVGEVSSQTTGIMNSRVYSKFVNAFVKDYLELLINDNPTEISQFMEDLIVPSVNEVLEYISWYEITAIILGLADGILPVEPIC
ncbi:uncharacterized protein [Drosophila tropicalis]|uniref:uncharacterized protein n=1 Tax=Drosophila tropicalis TaxID=46794 RepID=UPI0035AC17AE